MEAIVLLVILFLGFLFLGALAGMIASARTRDLQRRLDDLEQHLRRSRGDEPPKAAAPPPPVEPDAAPLRGPTRTDANDANDAIIATPPVGATVVERVVQPPPLPTTPVAVPPVALPAAAASPPPPVAPPVVEVPLQSGPPSREEPLPTPSGPFEGVEKTFGLRWLTWIGIGLLFLGIAFFLKYAYDRDWLGRLFGPRMRIATAAGISLAMVVAGWRSVRTGMTTLGQSLLGGGQALAYLTVYAALQPAVMVVPEPLLAAPTAFGLMVLVTALGLVTAVRLDAIVMAVLAVLGGFATPVLVSSGTDARDALCGYLLLLDVGVLAAAFHRRWRALDLLAFAGTVLLFGGWYLRWHQDHPQPDATLVWLALFHLVFLLLPFAHHYRHRTAVTGERFMLAIANVAWAYGYAGWMLREAAPRLLAASCAVGAALYLVLGVLVTRRVGDDRRTRDGFLVLAAALTTLSLFHLLPVDTISTGWFVEAVALLWLGYRHQNPTIRWVALLVSSAAALRTLLVHLPAADPTQALVWNRWFAQLLVQSLGVGAFAFVHHRLATARGERLLGGTAGIAAGWWTLLAAGLEVHRHSSGHPEAWTPATTPLVVAWLQLTGVAAFAAVTLRTRSYASFVGASLPCLAAGILVGFAYARYPANATLVVNGCCLTGLAVVAALWWLARIASRLPRGTLDAPVLAGCAQLALSALATVEAAAWLQRPGSMPAPGTLTQVLGWVWLSLAVAGGLAALRSASARVLGIAMLPLLLALFAAGLNYEVPLAPHRLLVNERFLFAIVCTVVTAATAVALRQHLPKPAADRAPALALVLAMGFGAIEAVAWSRAAWASSEAAPWAMWLIGATAVAGSAGGLARARATANTSLRVVALLALAPALCVPLATYLVHWPAEWMFVNLRALLVAASVALAVWWAREAERLRMLRWVAFTVALLGLSVEPPVWILDHAGSGPGAQAEANRRALFAVTVTWVVLAVALLVHGFRRGRRTVRVVALTLFGATAAKLLVLDMSGAQQLYRILAFVLVGLVFVGASWLYHRAARRAG